MTYFDVSIVYALLFFVGGILTIVAFAMLEDKNYQMTMYHVLANLPPVSPLPVCFHFCDMHMEEANRHPCQCGECGLENYVPAKCNCRKTMQCVGCSAEIMTLIDQPVV